MKNTGADNRGPEDSVRFTVQDGTLAAHTDSALYFQYSGLGEVPQKVQPKVVPAPIKNTVSVLKALDPMFPAPPQAAQE